MTKKIKLIVICIIAILVFLLFSEKPILYRYFTYKSFVVELIYNNDLLLKGEYNNKTVETESIKYEMFSDEIHVKLPNHLDNVIINLKQNNKAYVYDLQVCFEYDELYCFIFRQSPRHFPLNNKTHKSDKLLVLNKDGEEVCSFETTRDEWIMDYENNTILIFNAKENSFYYKNITSGEVAEKTSNEIDRYTKIILIKQDDIWNVYFYLENELVFNSIVGL